MTFPEKYKQENTWYGKALVMEIYHLAMKQRTENNWNLTNTAQHFGVSIGLVSENLRLADAIHSNSNFVKITSRQEALVKLRGTK